MLRYTRDNKGKEIVMADARVPLLRERLGLPAEPNSNYNAALAMAVGKFQKANNIQVTGQLNGPTIEAINPPSRAKRSTPSSPPWSAGAGCRATSARPTSCSTSRTINLRVYNNGAKVWQTRTVVGKAGHETPLLTETMKFITRQSDLERAAVDHLQRAAADL